MSVSRFLVENNGSNPDAIKLAFSQAYSQCKSAGLSNITLVFPTKGTFKTSDIAGFVGDAAAKALFKGLSVNLGDGIQLTFDIPKNINPFNNHDVVLAIYLTDKDMDIVDSINNVNSIVFLPWLEKDGKRWLSTWSPQTVGTSSWTTPSESLPENVREVILKLGRCINMPTGLSHPSDKEMAKKLFIELRKQGCLTSSELIRQFAVNNGWEPRRAEELAQFSSKYIE